MLTPVDSPVHKTDSVSKKQSHLRILPGLVQATLRGLPHLQTYSKEMSHSSGHFTARALKAPRAFSAAYASSALLDFQQAEVTTAASLSGMAAILIRGGERTSGIRERIGWPNKAQLYH